MNGLCDLDACHRALLHRRGQGHTLEVLAEEIGVSVTIVKYLVRESYWCHRFTMPIRYKLRRWMGELTPQELFLERFANGESIQEAAQSARISIGEAHATLRKMVRRQG